MHLSHKEWALAAIYSPVKREHFLHAGALKLLPDEENAPEISHTRIPEITSILVTASPR